MDVEQLGHFVQIRVLLSVLDYLQTKRTKHLLVTRVDLWSPTNWDLRSTHLPRDGHPVEDVPQDDAHHHLVPQVEDDAFPVVVPLDGNRWGGRGGRHRAGGRVLRFTLRADSSPYDTVNRD